MSEGGVAKSEARRSAEVEGAAAAKAAPACTPARAAVLLVVLGVVAAVVVDAFTGKHVRCARAAAPPPNARARALTGALCRWRAGSTTSWIG